MIPCTSTECVPLVRRLVYTGGNVGGMDLTVFPSSRLDSTCGLAIRWRLFMAPTSWYYSIGSHILGTSLSDTQHTNQLAKDRIGCFHPLDWMAFSFLSWLHCHPKRKTSQTPSTHWSTGASFSHSQNVSWEGDRFDYVDHSTVSLYANLGEAFVQWLVFNPWHQLQHWSWELATTSKLSDWSTAIQATTCLFSDPSWLYIGVSSAPRCYLKRWSSEHSNFSSTNLDAHPRSWIWQTNLDEELTSHSDVVQALAGTFFTTFCVTSQTPLVWFRSSRCICKFRCLWHWGLYPNGLTKVFLVLWKVCQTRFHCSSNSNWGWHGCFTSVYFFPQNSILAQEDIHLCCFHLNFSHPPHQCAMGFSLTHSLSKLLSTSDLKRIISDLMSRHAYSILELSVSYRLFILRRGIVCHLKYKLVIVKMTTSTQKNFQQANKTVRMNQVRGEWIKS